MRTFAVLTENGEVLLLFEKYQDIDLEESPLSEGEAIVRIDSYTILANGPAREWKRD